MRALTVNDVYKIMKQEKAAGRGDYTVMVTDDDEANDYHYLWYGAQTVTEAETPVTYHDYTVTPEIDTDDRVAPHDKHIIIG